MPPIVRAASRRQRFGLGLDPDADSPGVEERIASWPVDPRGVTEVWYHERPTLGVVSSHGRILALDVGDRRIGLAITDELGLTAQPLFTIHRTTLRADLKSIARFIRQHRVAVLVVGNPLHADGTPGAQAAKSRAIADALRDAHPALEHHFLDERLTTREAHALLDDAGHAARLAGRSHGRSIDRKDLIDQVAAVLLLEAFLSRRDGPALLPDPGSPNVK